MTAKEKERKKTAEHIGQLHEKYYGKKKVREAAKTAKTAKADKERKEAHQAAKKAADVAAVGTKTTGVGISSHPKEGNGKLTRKELMSQAQAKGIKYFRILHREELTEVLKQHDRIEVDSTAKSKIFAIQEVAQKRWKAGWTSLKDKEAKTPEAGKKKEKASAYQDIVAAKK